MTDKASKQNTGSRTEIDISTRENRGRVSGIEAKETYFLGPVHINAQPTGEVPQETAALLDSEIGNFEVVYSYLYYLLSVLLGVLALSFVSDRLDQVLGLSGMWALVVVFGLPLGLIFFF